MTLNASLAEIARRRYAINAVRAAETEVQSAQDRLDARSKDDAAPGADSGSVESLAGQAELKIAWDAALPEQFQLREEAVLRADLAQLSDALKALDRQMAEKLATQKRLDMSIAFQNKLMETLNQRVRPGSRRLTSTLAPRSIFITPRKSWKSLRRRSRPTKAS